MKKKQQLLGYQALPTRSVSPPVNQQNWIGRRGSGPLQLPGEQQQTQFPQQQQFRRPQRPGLAKPIAPGQPGPPIRSRERFIYLPEELQGATGTVNDAQQQVPTIFEDLLPEDGSGWRGRITVYCVAENIDRKELELRLRERGGSHLLEQYPDVLYGQIESVKQNGEVGKADVFYFDYGVLVFWGLTEKQERDVIRNIAMPCLLDPLPQREIEVDEFAYHYAVSEKPHIQNDTITINYRLANDPTIKLSISHALAQSTKLSVYEARVMEIVECTKDLPEILATTGKVKMSRKQIAQLIGRVFLQKSAVNLLSTVLDTPEFFWSAPDSMQSLYKRVCEYIEYDERVEVLNNRFQVIQEMLDMLRDHQNNFHTARLEWVVIILILMEVLVGLFECASILGWVGAGEHSP